MAIKVTPTGPEVGNENDKAKVTSQVVNKIGKIMVTPRAIGASDLVELSKEEFKKWLKKFDYDRDGRISAEELRQAIRAAGGMFSKMKANYVMKAIDSNSDGFIDDDEINKIVVFAEKLFGLKIVDV